MKIGDKVFLLKEGKIKKLDSHYTGPYEILELLGKGNVKISYKGKPTVVHINRLIRSCESTKVNKINVYKNIYFIQKNIYNKQTKS